MDTDNKCVGLGGWLFGHNYEPRHTKKISAAKLGDIKLNGYDLVNILDKFCDHESIYHGDICVRCGHTIVANKI